MNLKLPNRLDRVLNVKNILERTTEAEIFRHFFGEFKVRELYISPLRANDTIPSFNIYINKYGDLKYKDWGHSSGSCFDFVMNLKNVDFRGALSIISAEMNLDLNQSPIIYKEYQELNKLRKRTFARARVREWKEYDAKYWKQYDISSSTLDFFDIYPGEELWKRKEGESWKRFWINTEDNPLYIYKLQEYSIEDDKLIFGNSGLKAYRPYQSKEYGRDGSFKWFTGVTGNFMQGLTQLPDSGELLFLTSSLKDVCTLYEIGISALAPNAESPLIDELLIEYLKKRWSRIVVNYDSDSAGVRASTLLVDKFNLEYWNIPKHYNAKDVSDFVKIYSKKELIEIIKI